MSFAIRTFDVREAGRRYKVTVRVPQEKELDDLLSYMAERYRTSGVAIESFGPFDLVIREAR